MKYMGSKRWMLQNGLGMLLRAECADANRFVDLFAGSGAVACFVAEKTSLLVLASDLQAFSVVLSEAIIGREKAFDADGIWSEWLKQGERLFPDRPVQDGGKLTQTEVFDCRAWSEQQTSWPFVQAYGGHYYSPKQALWIDILRRTLPERKPFRTVALAALIHAASRCAASPGHTAQPFQPTRRAKKFLKEAWSKDILTCTQQALATIASHCAIRKGSASVADAITAAQRLKPGDIAFIDPPYSGVQYSRFYHVLEAIASGEPGVVTGAGRYPARTIRPQSRFSMKTHSRGVLHDLLGTIAERQAKAILTFPDHKCSNGLSGDIIRETAAEFFWVTVKTVVSKFSTLGGNNSKGGNGREARQMARELILSLTPKK